MTWKNALQRGLFGAPIGVFISTTITILISVAAGGFGGNFYSPVVPELAEAMGGELNAVVFQYGMSLLLGFAFAAGSAIYEIEGWSIARQTAVHFLLSSTAMLPVAYACHWVVHTWVSVVLYFAVFAAIYFVIWLVLIGYWKRRIGRMNRKLRNK